MFYGAGGGGGGWIISSGEGGLGGGGMGGYHESSAFVGQPGLANTGSGGGGGGWSEGTKTGGDGGSGIVIIRYRIENHPIIISNGDLGFQQLIMTSGSLVPELQTIKISNMIYHVYKYTDVGSYSITLSQNTECDVLIVGGGGSGGVGIGGGGGGGAVLYGEKITIPAGTYNITVGNGADFGTDGDTPNGEDTIAFGATVKGGGSAYSKAFINDTGFVGKDGGSGSGAKSYNGDRIIRVGGSVTPSIKGDILSTATVYGNVGGAGVRQNSIVGSGGGGGAGSQPFMLGYWAEGAGANGINSSSNPPPSGGNGFQCNIDGNNYYYGGGGGGGNYGGNSAGNGGLGGGGGGGGTNNSGQGTGGGSARNAGGNGISGVGGNGGANTGGGGGGSGFNIDDKAGNGGSGIVIVRYLISS